MTTRIASWLVALFAPADQAESILGDLQEEFSEIAAASGLSAARRWYRRQAAKTIVQLMGGAFRKAPWIAAVVLAGLLLGPYAFALPRAAVDAILEKYRVFDSYPDVYLFSLTTVTQLLRVGTNVLAGMLVALAAKGREMPATVALALVRIAMAIAAVLTARPVIAGYLWTLPWMFAFCLANVAGGAIVRMRRRPAVHPLAG